jgi:hypothetical protein
MSPFFASIFAAWLAVCLLEPMQLHLCAMHGGLAIDASTATSHLSAGAHAGHKQHQQARSHHDPDGKGHGDQCSCLGDCSAGNAPSAVASSEVSIDASIETTVAVHSFRELRPGNSASDLLLPFSNGPPAIS